MEPNAALPKLPLGLPSGGVLVRLKASARKSARKRSVILNVLPTITSATRYAGPETGLRELLPMVNWGACVNAAVLKKRAVVRSLAGSVGSATRFGRWMPKPANAFRFVA